MRNRLPNCSRSSIGGACPVRGLGGFCMVVFFAIEKLDWTGLRHNSLGYPRRSPWRSPPMKKALSFMIIALTLGIASMDADAARRFGGGGNLGKQRAVPTQREATPGPAPTQNAAPAKPAQPSPAATPPVTPPKPSFMQRWGGLLAGLGIGMLLTSLF